MPAWPGGPCPDCGEEMPPRILRCRTCGAHLSSDVELRPLVPPEPVELPEVRLTSEAAPQGYYVGCPDCEQELRIAARFEGYQVQCKLCSAPFAFVRTNATVRRIAMYLDCPHCGQELRVAWKYAGARVACKFCDGPLRIVLDDS